MSNVVFFGQADAGKSTMAGYLLSKFAKEFSLIHFLQSVLREYPAFDKSLVYSAIVNTNRDETESSKIGRLNTMSTHLRNVSLPFGEVTIIDTPGSERFVKQRERGIYYGNVGIFFMEVNNLISSSYMSNTIAPLTLWSKLSNKRMVFLVTKMDTVNYSERCFDKAKGEIYRIFKETGYPGDAGVIPIIPTAIDVSLLEHANNVEMSEIDPGENIVQRSKQMSWYHGPTFLDAMEREIRLADEGDSNERLMFCVTDQVDRPNSGAGKVWNIKVLSGILHGGDRITLAPVKNKHGAFVALTAQIKTIRRDISKFEEREDMRVARKSQICGIDMSMMRINGHAVSKSDFDAVSTSCGFAGDTEYKMSQYIILEVGHDNEDAFRLGRTMKLLWFGRAVSFRVVSMTREDNRVRVAAQLLSRAIALPTIEDNKIASEAVLIKGDGLQEFYDAKLIDISKKSS